MFRKDNSIKIQKPYRSPFITGAILYDVKNTEYI